MSWLAQLFRPRQTPPKGTRTAKALLLEGNENVPAVGESHYQPALRSACGAPPEDAVQMECTAALVLEPDNPHDGNAVMVQVNGQQCGHLSRSDALRYRQAMLAAAEKGFVVACRAVIAGRGADGETTNLGVFLHLPDPDDALESVQET